jgi:hypothetical protein
MAIKSRNLVLKCGEFTKMTNELLSVFEEQESILIKNFKQHPIFCKINQLSQSDFLKILIQRRGLSFAITPVYELAIDTILDQEVISTIKEILHEEYPRDTNNNPLPSHRELLMRDIMALGASRDYILDQPLSQETIDSIFSVFKLLTNERHNQIGTIALVRFWGEVLVAEEYSCFWKRMQNTLSENKENGKPQSQFYWYHMKHDQKKQSLEKQNPLDSGSHSERLAEHLKDLIKSEEDMRYCLRIEEESQKMKLRFYDQFLGMLEINSSN